MPRESKNVPACGSNAQDRHRELYWDDVLKGSPYSTPAREARIDQPWGLAVERGGRVYFFDLFNNRVRRIEPDGTLRTVAGSGEAGDAGDGGGAARAQLNEPHGLCLYSQDVLLVSDYYNNRIRAIRLDG